MTNDYKKVPTKIIVYGDTERGRSLIGLAKSFLRDMEESMQFQNLKQLSKTLTPYKGVVVELWHGFGLSRIIITVKEVGGALKSEPCYGCVCGCHVSFGFVIFKEPENCLDHILDLQFTYDVEICNSETTYIEVSDCQPTDFTKFNDGDSVFVLWVPDAALGEKYVDSTEVGCAMDTSTWARILPVEPSIGKFVEKPC